MAGAFLTFGLGSLPGARARKARVVTCMIGGRGIPSVQGGVETHCEELAPRLAELDPGGDLVVLARRQHVAAQSYQYKNVRVVALPAPSHPYLETLTHTLLGVCYARFVLKARLVHLHAVGPSLMAPLARLLGLRVVMTHHSRNYLHEKWHPVARLALRMGEAFAATFADRIIAVSPSLAADMRRRYPEHAHKLHSIPNGAPDMGPPMSAAQVKEVLARRGVAPGQYILAVGRITPEKGLHDLVAAMKSAGITRKLLICGRADSDSAYARELVAAAGPNVAFAGFVPHSELFALYQQAGLFVLPSHHEGMPISALEAIGSGAPILLSDIEANLDLGLPAQHYFRAGDVADLAAKLAAPPKAVQFSREAFLARYDWDDIARRTRAVYAEALEA